MMALYDELAPSLAVRIVPARVVLYQDLRYKVVCLPGEPFGNSDTRKSSELAQRSPFAFYHCSSSLTTLVGKRCKRARASSSAFALSSDQRSGRCGIRKMGATHIRNSSLNRGIRVVTEGAKLGKRDCEFGRRSEKEVRSEAAIPRDGERAWKV